jgi:thiol:disulfide interchange protein
MCETPFRRFLARGLAWMAAALLSVSAVAQEAKTPKPAHKDSGPFLRPKKEEADFTASVNPAEAKPGETVKYKVTAKLGDNWHIYKYAKEQPQEGPRATQFDFFDTAGLKIKGDWTASKKASQKKEEAFGGLLVEFYEQEVTWSIPLEIPVGTAAGKKTLRCQIYFQICNDNGCKSPAYVTVPDAVLTIQPGGAATVGAPSAAPKAEASAPAAGLEGRQSPTRQEDGGRTPPVRQAVATNVVEQSLEQGLAPFLLLAVTGGLIALVMPCVWPMVPITVNFFVKQGQAKKGKTLGLAITYCLAIIAIFTLVGVLFSALFGAAYLQRLANAAWLNIAVAALFLAFGLSLLGLFEFRLPSFLLNASAQGESRGGLIGVVFMALTLTITSFTCTFPVVGGLLVMAAGGNYLYPVLGLATFATVLALPFFLLALAPGLLSKVPRSGDWMNAVKVVGGLVEIGAAFKFLNTAECAYVTPEDAWIDAQVVLAVWVVLALVCGIYLLGLFRTDHDHDAVKVGPGRILFGALFLCLGLYLAPALFGHPPKSQFYDRLVVGLLPADAYELNGPPAVAGDETTVVQEPTSSDPQVAIRQKTSFHGVTWGFSFEAAKDRAQAQGKPILIDFTGVNCANCRLMEQHVMPRAEVVPLLKQFITVQLYTDYVPIKTITAAQREALAEANAEFLVKLANDNTNPFYAVLSPQGEVLATIGGYREPPVFVEFLKRGLDKFRDGHKVARTEMPDGQ